MLRTYTTILLLTWNPNETLCLEFLTAESGSPMDIKFYHHPKSWLRELMPRVTQIQRHSIAPETGTGGRGQGHSGYITSYHSLPSKVIANTFLKKEGKEDWRDGSAAKNTGCSSKGPRFHSQHLVATHSHLWLQFQDIWHLSWFLWVPGTQMLLWHTCGQNIHTQKKSNNNFLKRNVDRIAKIRNLT